MKKVFLILFICMACDLSAQWAVGGKVGINWFNVTHSKWNTEGLKWKTGFNIGAVGKYSLNDWIDLQSELIYSQRGFTYSLINAVNASSLDVNTISQNIDVPVMIKLYPFKKKECFNFQTGIQTGFLLTESVKSDQVVDLLLYEKKNPVDFGLLFGMAYNFEKGLFLDARYILGLTNTYKKYDRVKGRTIELSIGYFF